MATTTDPTTSEPDGKPSGKLETGNTPGDPGDWYVYDDAARPGSRLYCTAQGRDADVAEARAVYLARAVNAHEALLEAAQRALTEIAADVAERGCDSRFGTEGSTLRKLRAALALAHGEAR